jgi:hypothetical protein
VQTSPDTVPATANTNVLHDGSAVLSAVVDPHGLSTQVKVLQGTKNLRTGQVTTGPFLHGRVGAQTVSGGPTIVQFSPQNLDGGDYTFQIIATNGDGADQTADPAATGAFSLHIPAAITNSYPGCTLGPGSTPKAPTFDQTPTVASVNDQSATLSATIDPQRCNTLVSVSYRPVNTTASHALTTTAQQIGGCTRGQGACVPTPPTALQLPVPGQIGGGVAGLQPDTTYEANVIAASSAGTTTSPTITFTTSSALLPQTATATATTASSTMTCATKQTCSGTAVIAVPAGGFALDGGAARAATSGRLIVLGSVRFRIRGHHHAVIKVPLNAKGRRAVRGHRTLKAVLVITFRPPGKTPYTVRHPIKVVRRR